MLDLQDKTTQTDPMSKPGSPVSPRRPLPSARNIVRQPPVPRPQQPIVKREPRPVAPPRAPPNVHVATAAGDETLESLPAAQLSLTASRPKLPPKRQQQNYMREIHVPTTLLRRRGPASDASSPSAPTADGGPLAAVEASGVETADGLASAAGIATSAMVVPGAVMKSVVPAAAGAATAGPVAQAAATATHGKAGPGSVQTSGIATPQLGIMTAGNHGAPPSGKGTAGTVIIHGSPHVASSSTIGAKSGAGPLATAGLSMLGQSSQEPVGMAAKSLKQQGNLPKAKADAAKAASLPGAVSTATIEAKVPDRVVMPTPETQEAASISDPVEARPMSAMTDEPLDAASTPGSSRLQTPQQATAYTADISPLADSTVPEPSQAEAVMIDPAVQDRPVSAASAGEASESRPGTAEPVDEPVPQDSSWRSDAAYDQVLQVHRAAAGRIHRNRAHARPQSPLQTQISSIHGNALAGSDSPPSVTAGITQRTQQGGSKVQMGKTGKVPSLNMSVMRALKQQVSGLVPLDSRGGSKTARTVLQQTAPASQRALSSKPLPSATASAKAESLAQLTPLASSPLHSSRALPEALPPNSGRGTLPQSSSQDALRSANVLPVIASAFTPRQILPLDATVQLIGDIYDSKGVADLAALRQQVPCRPMQEFVQQYVQQRFGTGLGGSWVGAWQQLEAAVKVHGGDVRVAAFGVTCGLLQSAALAGSPSSAQVW